MVGLVLKLVACIVVLALSKFLLNRPSSRLAALKGPSNPSLLFGRSSEIANSSDRGSIYERWAKVYGLVYKTPAALGGTRIILCDPKAAAHLFAKDTYTYVGMPIVKKALKKFLGSNMLFAEGEDHKRQRRAMAPAFSNAALSGVTHVFYDSAYKVKAHWDALIQVESTSQVTLDVQKWMNRITLDSIGIAGFGHHFKSIDGQQSPVIDALSAFGEANQGFASRLIFILGAIIPQVINIPVKRIRLFAKLNEATSKIAEQLLKKSRREKQDSGDVRDRSILGILVRGEAADTNLKLSHEEVVALNFFLVAGYETTAASLSWALAELARNPETQQKLREELHRHCSNNDPTWDQLRSELPYLDAVVHETLRLHPVVEELSRLAAKDDSIPLSSPIQTTSGQTIDSVFIPKGTILGIPVMFFNRSETWWGPDAKQFVPERWLTATELTAHPALKDLHGHRHLFTFADGPRICLGRGFALGEFKVVLSVLVRNFMFELPDGQETRLEKHLSILARPKLAGEVGAVLPMRIRRAIY